MAGRRSRRTAAVRNTEDYELRGNYRLSPMFLGLGIGFGRILGEIVSVKGCRRDIREVLQVAREVAERFADV